MLICSECNSLGLLYSKEDTKRLLKEQLIRKIKDFMKFSSDYDLEELIYIFHRNRDKLLPLETFFSRFFSLTYGLGLLLKYQKILSKNQAKNLELGDLNLLFDICRTSYLDRHHLFFARLDAVRILKLKENDLLAVKYTENWLPIYKRQILHGSTVSEPNLRNKLEMDLFAENHYRKIIMEELIEKNPEFEAIAINLDYLQNYLFHFPWGDYLKVGRSIHQIDQFINIINVLPEKNVLFPQDRIIIKRKIKDYIINHWKSTKIKSEAFPIIIEINNKWFLPKVFLNLLKDIYKIFSSKNRSTYGKYQTELGIILENRVFHDLKAYNLDFQAPLPSREKLIRFLDPENKRFELFDVGALDHKFKRFFVIECKNKIKIIPRNYDPIKLNEYIQDEFKEFRDRDLPKIRVLMNKWNFHDYEIIPMFYNFVPLYGEFEDIGKFKRTSGIYIIQNFAEIGSIIQYYFRKDGASFYEIYKVPRPFKDIITGRNKLAYVKHNSTMDLGVMLGQESQKYLLHTGVVNDLSLEGYFPEIDIKLDYPETIISADLPPELSRYVHDLKLSIKDRISAILYRNGPYSQVFILGKIWKL